MPGKGVSAGATKNLGAAVYGTVVPVRRSRSGSASAPFEFCNGYWRSTRRIPQRGSCRDQLVEASGAEILQGSNMACYRIREDHIEMLSMFAFVGTPTSSATQAYAATLLHELVHWTGAAHRLDRGFRDRFDKESLAAEARRSSARRSAAPISAPTSGVSKAPRPDHAAYVASWLKLDGSKNPLSARGA
jgi:antirestriction protein ArdC